MPKMRYTLLGYPEDDDNIISLCAHNYDVRFQSVQEVTHFSDFEMLRNFIVQAGNAREEQEMNNLPLNLTVKQENLRDESTPVLPAESLAFLGQRPLLEVPKPVLEEREVISFNSKRLANEKKPPLIESETSEEFIDVLNESQEYEHPNDFQNNGNVQKEAYHEEMDSSVQDVDQNIFQDVFDTSQEDFMHEISGLGENRTDSENHGFAEGIDSQQYNNKLEVEDVVRENWEKRKQLRNEFVRLHSMFQKRNADLVEVAEMEGENEEGHEQNKRRNKKKVKIVAENGKNKTKTEKTKQMDKKSLEKMKEKNRINNRKAYEKRKIKINLLMEKVENGTATDEDITEFNKLERKKDIRRIKARVYNQKRQRQKKEKANEENGLERGGQVGNVRGATLNRARRFSPSP